MHPGGTAGPPGFASESRVYLEFDNSEHLWYKLQRPPVVDVEVSFYNSFPSIQLCQERHRRFIFDRFDGVQQNLLKEVEMGTKGREIVNMDVGKLVELLNKAFADEWLAYYQYWVGAEVAQGPMRQAVVDELEEHASEELGHAGKLAERIIQLGGHPLLKPEDWLTKSNCGYESPEDPSVERLLEQNIEGEQCAIEVYQQLLSITKEADPITYHLVLEILADEVEHEEDLQAISEDLRLMKERKG